LIFILSGLFWNTLISTHNVLPIAEIPVVYIRLAVLAGILGLAALTTALVSLGWSWKTSRNGLIWGVVTTTIIYLVSTTWGATQLRPNQPEELWNTPPGPLQAELLSNTLNELSDWQTGFYEEIDIISTIGAPSLRWILRNNPNVLYTTDIPISELPSIVVTHQSQTAPSLTAAYRGQDFVWWTWPDWTGAFPPDFINWLTFRQAPIRYEQIILWARSDLFPGGTLETDPNSIIDPGD
jgi:hypothetical protein